MRIFIYLIGMLLCFACSNSEEEIETVEINADFETYQDFINQVEEYTAIENEAERDSILDIFIDKMKANKQLPFIRGEKVAFVYHGNATAVQWAGDFNRWNATNSAWKGRQLNESQLWILEKSFPLDARLDYKVVPNGNWQLDPLNSYIQYSGFGPNSELRMPNWEVDSWTMLDGSEQRGTLSSNKLITSSALGYDLQYKVYLPYNYNSLDSIPMVYVTDGHEYSDDRLGAMVIVTDKMIDEGEIEPLGIVFVDPRNPSNLSENRRADQFRSNPKFAQFFKDELIPAVDGAYNTIANRSGRAILGTSLGGWNAAYFGHELTEEFKYLGIHSPAFGQATINAYNNSAKMDLKIFMSTGVINDTEQNANALEVVLKAKGYDYQYYKVNEGHSWGNWRALLNEPLSFFFK